MKKLKALKLRSKEKKEQKKAEKEQKAAAAAAAAAANNQNQSSPTIQADYPASPISVPSSLAAHQHQAKSPDSKSSILSSHSAHNATPSSSSSYKQSHMASAEGQANSATISNYQNKSSNLPPATRKECPDGLVPILKDAGPELMRHLLLSQFDVGIAYLSDNPEVQKCLSMLLEIPETGDPDRDMNILLFKWCVNSFMARANPPEKRPDVPIHFSTILPEFQDVDTLFMYAQCPSDDLFKIYQAYPYDFFNVIKKMTPQFANDFIIACLFNRRIPIHLGGRLISLFELSQIHIDYTLIFEKRCTTFYDMSLFFEGLLCNSNSQSKAAEYLAGDYDSALADDSLIVTNGTLRSLSHFVDKYMDQTIEMFPSAQTILFLRQTATTPLAELAKTLKHVQPNEYVNRLRNQINLLQILGLGEDWTRLDEHSVPVLLPEDKCNELLYELPRTSTFFTYQSVRWQIDYDFIQSFVALKGLIWDLKMNTFPQYLYYDLFSLLFLVSPFRKRNHRRSSTSDLHVSESSFHKTSSSTNFRVKPQPAKEKYFFNLETAINAISTMKKNDDVPEDIRPYIEAADKKLKTAQALFENPTINDALYTIQYYYELSLKSTDFIEKMINLYGDPPLFVKSRYFSLLIEEKLGIQPRAVIQMPLKGRIIHGQIEPEKVEIDISSTLCEYPPEIQTVLLLDFVSSHKKYSSLARLAPDLDKKYQEFISLIRQKVQRYPRQSVLNLNESRSILEYKKRLTAIIACHLPNSLLDAFSRYLLSMTNIPTQSLYKFHTLRPQAQIQNLIDSSKSLKELLDSMAATNIDPILFLLSKNRPDQMNQTVLQKFIGEDPLIFIPFAQGNLEPKKLAASITNKKFSRVKKYFEINRRGNDQFNPAETIKELENAAQDEVMDALEDLLYQGDISAYFAEILELIRDFPTDWCINYIETYIALLNPGNVAVFPLQQKLLELRPPPDMTFEPEIERVSVCWDALMKMVTKYQDIVTRPHEFFRLCAFHLKNHLIGNELISNIRYFTHLIIATRKFKVFQTREKEQEWAMSFMNGGISNLSVSVIAEMIVDIGLNLNFNCGKLLAKFYPDIDLSTVIKKFLPRSVKLLDFLEPEKQVEMVNNILGEQKVESEADEAKLSHLLAKMRSYANNITLYTVLDEFVHNYIFSKSKTKYNGSSLTKLYDIATFKDINTVVPLLRNEDVKMTPGLKSKYENNLSLFGLVANRISGVKTKIFTSPPLEFNVQELLNIDREHMKGNANIPTLYSMVCESEKMITIFKIPLQKKDVKTHVPPDYQFYEIHYQPPAVTIKDDIDSVLVEVLNAGTAPWTDSKVSQEGLKFNGIAHMKQTIGKYLSKVNCFELFESLAPTSLHTLIKFANAKGLINLMLQLVMWTLNKEEMYKSFIFPRSLLKDLPENERKAKSIEFLNVLKKVLVYAIKFSKQIDPLLLINSNVVPSGNIKTLKDLLILMKFQGEIGVKNLNLFSNKSNKVEHVARLFAYSDYERGFTMIRILHLDTNAVLLKATTMFNQASDVAKLVFNVVPRLDIDSANKLIESITSSLSKTAQNRSFLNLLVSGVEDSRNVYQMLTNFGFNETASMVAIQEGLSEEIEKSSKYSKMKNLAQMSRSCDRWIKQHTLMQE